MFSSLLGLYFCCILALFVDHFADSSSDSVEGIKHFHVFCLNLWLLWSALFFACVKLSHVYVVLFGAFVFW